MLLPTSKKFTVPEFPLIGGGRLAPLTVAYETWGTLAPEGRNALLLCHGYTSNPHAAGDEGGWWHNLIGPGRAVDTDRYFVVCSNMLGSAFGTSGPQSIDLATGRPFGPSFPDFVLPDMVAAQKLLLEHLGVRQLAAVMGFSFGGHLATQWSVMHPDFMRATIIVASGIKGRGDAKTVDAIAQRFAKCPGWNDGNYYDSDPTGSVRAELKRLRLDTLRGYGVDVSLRDRHDSEAAAAAALDKLADDWAGHFDANSLIQLRRAAIRFDGRPHLSRIQGPVLYVLSRTDALFPPDIAPPTMQLFAEAGVAAEYFEIDSEYGHFAPSGDWQKWGPALAGFLDRHAR